MSGEINIRLKIQYNGMNYFGWQIQNSHITIQEVLQKCISNLLKEEIDVIGCSRTDSKVHAIEYVCNFKSHTTIPPEKLKFALNPKLPRDIVVLSSEQAESSFHARYSCIGKKYSYKILNRDIRPVFQVKGLYHFKYRVDIEAMRAAAKYFVGTHDFSAFKSVGSSVKTSIRTIYSLEVESVEDVITIHVSGDGFLYNMVRIIVGTLLEVGSNKRDIKSVEEAIITGNRKNAGVTAPGHGLYLSEVFYHK